MTQANRNASDEALNIKAIERALKDREIGSDIRFFDEVDSTNRVARDLAPGDWRSGTVIWTNYQTAGRGRMGRSWQAPPHTSLLLSILRTPIVTASIQAEVMPASLAVHGAIRAVADVETMLKWPNDILYEGRKLCGILAEVAGPQDDRRVIVGIGINVNAGGSWSPFPETATTLEEIVGHAVSRQDLALALFEHLNLWYGIFTEDQDAVFRAWSSSLHIAGKNVAVHDISGMWTGTVVEIRSDGALRIRDSEGKTRSVYAADVSIRKPGDFTSR